MSAVQAQSWSPAPASASFVSAYEAKTHLSALLERAQNGETIIITKHGVPVAQLVPAGRPARPAAELIAEWKEAREGLSLGPISIRELIEEGRRY